MSTPAPHVNVEGLEEMRRELSDAVAFLQRAKELERPRTWHDALKDTFFLRGEIATEFADFVKHIPQGDLKKWHIQAVECEHVIAALKALEQMTIHHFGTNEATRFATLLTAPLLKIRYLVENIGLVAEIMIRASEILVKALVDLGRRINIDVTAAGEEYSRRIDNYEGHWYRLVEDCFQEQLFDRLFEEDVQEVREAMESALLDAIKPLLERLAYEALWEIIIFCISAEHFHREVAPVFKTRDEAHSYIVSRILNQDNRGANAKFGKSLKLKAPPAHTRAPKTLLKAIQKTGRRAKKLLSDLNRSLDAAAIRGDKRWRRRKRTSRGTAKLADFARDQIFGRGWAGGPSGTNKLKSLRDKVEKGKKAYRAFKKKKAIAMRYYRRYQKLQDVKRRLHDGSLSDAALDALRKQERKYEAKVKSALKAKLSRTMKDARGIARERMDKEVKAVRAGAAEKVRQRVKVRYYPDRPIGEFLR